MIDEEKIRQRAYELWEQRGRPEGVDQDDWRQAREELEAGQPPLPADIPGVGPSADLEAGADPESDVLPTDSSPTAGQQGS
ncbi:MAG TPA: DUF2934 domain-containing protein [Pseudomonas sp.]|jgi:hypothetical protein